MESDEIKDPSINFPFKEISITKFDGKPCIWTVMATGVFQIHNIHLDFSAYLYDMGWYLDE